jgi:signal transduction histidine kinase
MNIRQKLTYQFLVIVSVILFAASTSIYIFSTNYRSNDFYERLINKASSTANLLISVDEIDINLLRRIERDNPTSLPRERLTVYNSDNADIFSTDHGDLLATTPKFLDSVRTVKQVRFQKDSFEVVAFVFDGKTKNNVVVAGAVDIYGKKRLANLKNTLTYVALVSLILVFLSGWFFAGQALAPIKNIIDRVDEIGINKLNLRVDEGKGKDELSRLAKTFNRMLAGLEEGFLIQKNFIANASHELRTPLTAITGQLEVDLLKDRTPAEYKETLESVLEDMKNLNSISNRLLLLTQTNLESSQLQFVPVRVDELLWQIKADLEKRNRDYHVLIDLNEALIDDRMLTVSGNEELLKVAFSNLADNGCKYSPDHKVWVKLNPEKGRIIIQFIDKGIGIDKSDLPQLFEPFYRGKNALSYKGHGIGLSLVKRIIAMHHGTLKAVSSPNDGTVFTVTLPLLR